MSTPPTPEYLDARRALHDRRVDVPPGAVEGAEAAARGMVRLATPAVMGLDLSLASTGLASSAGWTRRLTTPKPPARPRGVKAPYGDRARRVGTVVRQVRDAVPGVPALVVIEDQYAVKRDGQHDMYGAWWGVLADLSMRGIPIAVVNGATLKKYATGSGRAEKDEMVGAARAAFPWFDGGDDEADALWLATMGAQYLGVNIPAVPEFGRDSALLAAARWPDR